VPVTNRYQRQPAPLIEGLEMKLTRHRADSRPIDRGVLQAAAIIRYREWDAEMIRLHGPLYYREMQFSVH
jgi:hypothetical protein